MKKHIKHILLVDDNEVENFIAKTVINKKKITEKISSFCSVQESMIYLDSIKNKLDEFPDLIFLDINMPVLNGFDFLEQFSGLPKAVQEQCEVIMLTSSDDQSDKDQAMKYSVVKNYIIKPLKPSDLDCFHIDLKE